ncbi:MAG: sugar phosphate nucleotidyltransferase, partial [Thermoanaerobaculia bacterium]|nr:sugar phosphate nucleotidyltransferase [Thermoanaerobaculia bacterium]
CALILSGGAGTRLWPLSTEERPKQFLPLIDEQSLFQKTYERLSGVVDPGSIWVATVETYVPLIQEQVPSITRDRILVEPARRNTAPAIATAHSLISDSVGEHRLGVFPSDHHIADTLAFHSAVDEAYEFADVEEVLLTLAIPPTRPETGYGYLRLGEEISGRVRRVASFVEKPDLETAKRYVESGDFAWNGGMFIWESDAFDRSLQKFAPEIHSIAHDIAVAPSELRTLYEQMPAISIDYALMEKADNVVTVAAEYGWSDVGSWAAVAELTGASAGGVIQVSSNAWVRRDSERLIAVAGAEDLIIVDTPDALLVLNRDGGAEMMREVVRRAQASSEDSS